MALLWALAILRAGRLQPLLRGVSQLLADRVEASLAGAAEISGGSQLASSQLCTAVWACGQLRHGDPRMLGAASALLLSRVEELGPSDTAR